MPLVASHYSVERYNRLNWTSIILPALLEVLGWLCYSMPCACHWRPIQIEFKLFNLNRSVRTFVRSLPDEAKDLSLARLMRFVWKKGKCSSYNAKTFKNSLGQKHVSSRLQGEVTYRSNAISSWHAMAPNNCLNLLKSAQPNKLRSQPAR